MRSLQTVAMGLVIVFLDVGSDGWDWVADPVGWILVLVGLAPLKERLRGYAALVVVAWACLAVSVLTLPPDSIDSIMPTLGWLFSLPTIAFAALLCGSLAAATDGSRSVWFRSLGGFFVIVAVLPAVVYLVGLDWLTVPAAVAAVLANVALVFSTWGAGAEDDEQAEGVATERRATVTPGDSGTDSGGDSGGGRKKRDQGFDAEAVKRRVRRARDGNHSASATESAASGTTEGPLETPAPGGRRKQPQGFDAEAVKERVRREREQWAERGE